jgi:uncharacterized SAM-binding protein YcdF (DUF218 family)
MSKRQLPQVEIARDTPKVISAGRRWKLFGRRQIVVPTWRGTLLILIVLLVAGFLLLHGAYSFLAPSHPLGSGVLVVEGWAPDYALSAAASNFKQGNYQKLFVTGGPIENGGPLIAYKTYAQLGAAILMTMGVDTNSVQAVPAPKVKQDRTYTSARALKAYLREHGGLPKQLDLITVGPHARRSWLLFRKAFGEQTKVGITSVPEIEYDSGKWWHYSNGVRSIIGELLAYCYARVLFHPATDQGN